MRKHSRARPEEEFKPNNTCTVNSAQLQSSWKETKSDHCTVHSCSQYLFTAHSVKFPGQGTSLPAEPPNPADLLEGAWPRGPGLLPMPVTYRSLWLGSASLKVGPDDLSGSLFQPKWFKWFYNLCCSHYHRQIVRNKTVRKHQRCSSALLTMNLHHLWKCCGKSQRHFCNQCPSALVQQKPKRLLSCTATPPLISIIFCSAFQSHFGNTME